MLTRRIWNCHYANARHNVRSSLRTLSFKYVRDASGFKESYIEVERGEFEIQKYIEGKYNTLREKHVRWDLEHTSLDASVRETLIPLVLRTTWCTNTLSYLRPQQEVVSSWRQTRGDSDGYDPCGKVLNVLDQAAQALDDTVKSLSHDIAACQKEMAQEMQREMYDRPAEHQEQFNRIWLPQYAGLIYRVLQPSATTVQATSKKETLVGSGVVKAWKANSEQTQKTTKLTTKKKKLNKPCLQLEVTANKGKPDSILNLTLEADSAQIRKSTKLNDTFRRKSVKKEAKKYTETDIQSGRKVLANGAIAGYVDEARKKWRIVARIVASSKAAMTNKKTKKPNATVQLEKKSKEAELECTNDENLSFGYSDDYGWGCHSWEVQTKPSEHVKILEAGANRWLTSNQQAGQNQNSTTLLEIEPCQEATAKEPQLVKSTEGQDKRKTPVHKTATLAKQNPKKVKVKTHGTSDTKLEPQKSSSKKNENEVSVDEISYRARASRIGRTSIEDDIMWAEIERSAVEDASTVTKNWLRAVSLF